MLLYIYLGTTAFVWLSEFKTMHDMDKRLKKEGYTFNGKKFNGIGDIVVGGLFLITMSIPVFNLIFPLASLDKERTYDEYKEMMLEAGHINEPEVETKNNKRVEIEYLGNIDNIRELYRLRKEIEEKKKNNIIDIDDAKLVVRTNKDGHIYYSTMAYDEELNDLDEKGYTYKKEFFRKKR